LVTSCLMRKTRLLSEPRFRGANPDRFPGQGYQRPLLGMGRWRNFESLFEDALFLFSC